MHASTSSNIIPAGVDQLAPPPSKRSFYDEPPHRQPNFNSNPVTSTRESEQDDTTDVDTRPEAEGPWIEPAGVFLNGVSFNVDSAWLKDELLRALGVKKGVNKIRVARKANGQSRG